MKYINKIQKFMYGRYGIDDLYHFLFKLYIFLLIIDLFVNSNILGVIEFVVVIVMFYRFFSKKIYRRSNENKIFLKLRNKVIKPFKKIKKKISKKINNMMSKDYIYKTCNKCGTILRLPIPYKYGIKHVKCPNCKKRQRVICLKKERIEVIKNNKKRRENSV